MQLQIVLCNDGRCTVVADMKQIHNFAVKWFDKFSDKKINYLKLVDHYMADDCEALGFIMDCGHAFAEKYGNAASNSEALERIIYQVTDIPLLGSAIYSRWRYFNHWAYSGEEILEPQNRKWFIIALSRTRELACPQLNLFNGDPDDEVEPHIPLNTKEQYCMSKITLINASCADQTVDAVVNAANSGLWAGGGICGVIFKKAGMSALTAACSKYKTPLKDGSAVITPAFSMTNAKHIIHAVGPDFGRTPAAFIELFDAYYNSLYVLMDNGLHSISFPLISSGIFGGALDNPVAESTKQCCRAYKKFVADYPNYNVDVKLCAFSSTEMHEALIVFNKLF